MLETIRYYIYRKEILHRDLAKMIGVSYICLKNYFDKGTNKEKVEMAFKVYAHLNKIDLTKYNPKKKRGHTRSKDEELLIRYENTNRKSVYY